MTAHDVVACARKRLGIKRIGHAGTLDPLAAGVLPVAVGAYTRLLPYLEGGKEYIAEIAFGRSTTSGDAAGDTLEARDVTIAQADLLAVLERFRGEITQVPPAFSAIHVGGRRAYEFARAGVAVEMPPRQVTIRALDLIRFDAGKTAWLRVDCSAGTYVRTLAADIGLALGVPAHLAFLLRTRAGPFGIADAQLLTAPEWAWIPPDVALAGLPEVAVSAQEADRLRHGQPIRLDAAEPGGRAMLAGDLVAIVEARDKALWPRTVLPA